MRIPTTRRAAAESGLTLRVGHIRPARLGESGYVRRGGFTFLEVILATAIGLLILVGVYQAIKTQLKVAESGRDAIERATLARSLMARISSDVAPCVGLPDPARYRTSATA